MTFEAIALYLAKLATLIDIIRTSLSPTYPLNTRGVLPRSKPFSKNSSSIHSRSSSRCTPYGTMKYAVLFAKRLVRLGFISLFYVTFSLVS